MPTPRHEPRPRGRPRRPDAEEVASAYAAYAGLSRGQIQRRDPAAYERLRRKGLLRLFPRWCRELDDPLGYCRARYPHVSRGELAAVDNSLYVTLRRRGLLWHVPLRRRKARRLGDPLAFYRKRYGGIDRRELRRRDLSLYNVLCTRGLLRHVPPAPPSSPRGRRERRPGGA